MTLRSAEGEAGLGSRRAAASALTLHSRYHRNHPGPLLVHTQCQQFDVNDAMGTPLTAVTSMMEIRFDQKIKHHWMSLETENLL